MSERGSKARAGVSDATEACLLTGVTDNDTEGDFDNLDGEDTDFSGGLSYSNS